MSATAIMNCPEREKRRKPNKAATAAMVAATAGTSHWLTATGPTSVTGQNKEGKMVAGQVPNTSMTR